MKDQEEFFGREEELGVLHRAYTSLEAELDFL